MNALRIPQVLEKTGLTRSALYRLLKEGEFPQPFKLTESSVAYSEEDIEQWIKERYENFRCGNECGSEKA